jgi:hypothetical protein
MPSWRATQAALPLPRNLGRLLAGQTLQDIDRRGKYLLFRFDRGTLIVHLGMSGSLRLVPPPRRPASTTTSTSSSATSALRLRDPRRFGAVLWVKGDAAAHPLIAPLGIEPLTEAFDGEWLHAATRGRATAVKLFLMDSHASSGSATSTPRKACSAPASTRAPRPAGCRAHAAPASQSRQGHAGGGHGRRRQHPARLHPQRRQQRLVPAAAPRLRPRRRALPRCGAQVRALRWASAPPSAARAASADERGMTASDCIAFADLCAKLAFLKHFLELPWVWSSIFPPTAAGASRRRHLLDLQDWLAENELGDAQSELRIQQLLERLREDKLIIAFVAEFSRGKSELINAIFFGDYGNRILPSTAGRTTMCPTELLFEAGKPPAIELLPIETRSTNASVAEFKRFPEEWRNVELDTASAEAMHAALSRVGEQKRVSPELAEEARLQSIDAQGKEGLKPDAEGLVEIPCWRHAVINFPTPCSSRAW